MAGAFHVHSTVSDGSAARPDIAAAAARAGLTFIVFTDHGDATRMPDPPAYFNGVLCIDAVEISTNEGHYVALGLGAAPYRLGGEASAVVEDVRRLGGFGVVAHPDSPKPELAWRDWTVEPGGVEWLNADTEWRNESSVRLARTLAGYLLRPGPALARMLDRPDVTLRRWDDMTRTRLMPAFAAQDAHGGIGGAVEGGRRSLVRVPSYEASFRSFAMRAVLTSPRTGDPSADAALLIGALRAGRSYTVIDGAAAPGWLEFTASRAGQHASMGERLGGAGAVTLAARIPGIDQASLSILRNGELVSRQTGSGISATATEPGAYRVEARLPGREGAAPWLSSNPVYVDLPPPPVATAPRAGRQVQSLLGAGWRIEHDPSSKGEPTVEGGRPGMVYTLAAGRVVSQFAALVAPLVQPLPDFDAVVFDIAAAAPSRISVQVRSADGRFRWVRSIYVTPDGGVGTLSTSSLLPAEPGTPPFEPKAAGSILLVADLVNATPGTSGRITVRSLSLSSSR